MSAEWVGRVIDQRYVVESVLGAGGMGLVLRAKHRFTGGTVAIKVLRSELSADPDIQHRFLAEAQAPNAIGHPSIVRVVDAGRDATGLLYLAMELLEGRSLRIPMARGELAPLAARRIMLELLDALAAAHVRGFVHRDLKPDNVFLVAPNDATKLLDFGIAKVLDAGIARVRTQTGITLGTPAYMAPEQLSDASSVDARADLWAAGVIVYEMLSGRLPFPGATIDQLIVAIATKEPDPIRAHLPHAPPALETFFARALARDPRMRFGAAIEMAQALIALPLETLRPTMPPAGAVAPMMTPPASYAATAAPAPHSVAAHTPAPPPAYVPTPHTAPPAHAPSMHAPQPPPAQAAPVHMTAPPPTRTAAPKSPVTLIIGLAAAAAVIVLVVLLVTRNSDDTTAASKTGSAAAKEANAQVAVAETPPPTQPPTTPPAGTPPTVDDAPKSRFERLADGNIFAADPKAAATAKQPPPATTPGAPKTTAANAKPSAPAASDAAACEQICKAAARCGFSSPTCVQECAVNPAKACFERAKNNCNAFARCSFRGLCNSEPSGSSTCAEAFECQDECPYGDVRCGCRCAQQMSPAHSLTLLRLFVCVAKCGGDELCVVQSCPALVNACAGTSGSP